MRLYGIDMTEAALRASEKPVEKFGKSLSKSSEKA